MPVNRDLFPFRRGKYYIHAPERGLSGERDLRERLDGLEPLGRESEGLSLLDLGCAEGHVVEYFLTAGVRLAHGFDNQRKRIAAARRLVVDRRARFEVGELSDWPRFLRAPSLEPSYDIVLLFSVYQQLPERTRAAALAGMAALCDRWFGLRLGQPALRAEACRVLENEGLVTSPELSSRRVLVFRRTGR